MLMLFLSQSLNLEIVPDNARAFITQVQILIIFYLVFRFNFFGLASSIVLSYNDLASVIIKYYQEDDLTYLIPFTLRLLTIIVGTIVAFLAYKQDLQKIKLQKLAITDELTDVYNQRQFRILLDREIVNSDNNNSSLGLIMLDIDDFNMYNDLYGHECGDKILKGTSAILKSIVKQNGYVCRYGGDEFAIIFPNTDIETLEMFAHNIIHKFKMVRSDYFSDKLSEKVTLSIGLSEYPNRSFTKSELISHSDMALYHAKNLGKGRVHLYQDIILQIRKNTSSDNQQLIGAFKGLLSTISAKDKYTHAHSERVSSYAVLIGKAMNLSLNEISVLEYAGLLHDIGKIEIPKTLLNKHGNLTVDEQVIIRQHPIYSENILEPLEDIDNLIDYVRHHHERFDGLGYPDGLTGTEISLGARILCVADSFDAMISERPYSRSKTTEEALSELRKYSGTQFDPEIVDIFYSAMSPAH
ncbi:bifunctional diguanylate cyclase/phosphohydrolase [Acetivibrio cellulolyticus]|uniref:bifunctional diguanylate cyclase/phosphohydrolase n=1 Tax=Acetivibrio cellulolyticus TaxID=35830 RepID=UPI0002481B33|nr:diguanylate cyclase [Acetivibrio cellulolyticus]